MARWPNFWEKKVSSRNYGHSVWVTSPDKTNMKFIMFILKLRNSCISIVYCDVIVPCAIVNAIDDATIPRDESGVVSCKFGF